MCGIVGYIGSNPVLPILLDGLKKLEYRGYDSAGVSFVSKGSLQTVKAAGNRPRFSARSTLPRNGTSSWAVLRTR